MKSFVLIATLLALAFVPARAEATSFSFSFGNGVETVTGEMTGIPLPDGTLCFVTVSCNWEATSMTFTSMSPEIAFAYGHAGGLDLNNLHQFNGYDSFNEWTVIDGEMVSGYFSDRLECILDCINFRMGYSDTGSSSGLLFAVHATFSQGIIVQDTVSGPLKI